ncbi:MAG: hypothetical protein ACTSUE_14720 [Promethearchaeota archaeon]
MSRQKRNDKREPAGKVERDRETWKQHEDAIKNMVREDPLRHLCDVKRDNVAIDVFYCIGVMRIVNFLVDEVKAKELAGPHNTFTIYFKHRDFGNDGYLEYEIGDVRIDIYIELQELKIQVKALSDIKVKDVEKQITTVDARGVEDRLWIFFFYQFKNHASPEPACKYLLVRISIDLLTRDLTATNYLVRTLMNEAKKQAAEVLDVEHEILIPMPNLVTDVELKRRIAERDRLIAEKDEIITEKDEIITEKDEIITEKDEVIAKLKERLEMEEK